MLQIQLVESGPMRYEVRDASNTLTIGWIEYYLDRYNQPCEYSFYPKDAEIMVTAQTLTGVLIKHFDDTVGINMLDTVPRIATGTTC